MGDQLTSAERSLRGHIGAYVLHSRCDSRELTKAARAAFASTFDRGLDPGEQDPGLAEVGLGLGPRVMGQRDRHPAQARPAVGSDPRPDGRLAAREAVLVAQALVEPPGGMALLAMDQRVGREPGLDERGDGVHDGRRATAGAPVGPGPRVVQGTSDRRPAVVQGPGELADARPFPEVGVPDTLDVDHLDHPFLQGGCGFNHRHRAGW